MIGIRRRGERSFKLKTLRPAAEAERQEIAVQSDARPSAAFA